MKISPQWFAAFALGACSGFALAALLFKSAPHSSHIAAEQAPVAASAPAARGQSPRGLFDLPPSGSQPRSTVPTASQPRAAGLASADGSQGAAGAGTTGGRDEYDFDAMANSPQTELQRKFAGEAEDAGWAPNAQESLRGFLDALPERSGMSSVDVECHASLCMVSITGDANALAPPTEKNNLQVDLVKFLTQSPGSELFDNQMTTLGTDPHSGLPLLTTYLHRRQQAAQGGMKG